MSALPTRYCIVGAGPNGLIAARALKRRGVEVDVIERNPGIGGIWEMNYATSPVYASCNFISDRDHSGFIGYPLPRRLPDFPRWDQIRDYIRDFADEYDITRHVTLNREVVSATPIQVENRTCWTVELDSGEQRLYRGVIWACGQQQEPYVPAIRGQESFSGTIIHAARYKHPREFVDKRVVVVGAGNSGVDIVSDAASVADKAILSARRAYRYMPQSIMGISSQAIIDGSAKLPPGIELPDTPEDRLKWISDTVQYERIGLDEPEYPINGLHGTLNDTVIHHLIHGHMTVKPDIDFLDGREVVFVDGTREEADLVVLATGFTMSVPWLDPEHVEWYEGFPYFHLGSMSRKVKGLYACGALHFGGPTYFTWDRLFQVAAAEISDELALADSPVFVKIREEFDPDLKAGLPLVDTRRNKTHSSYAAIFAACETLRDSFGIPMPNERDSEFYAVTPAKQSDSVTGLAAVFPN